MRSVLITKSIVALATAIAVQGILPAFLQSKPLEAHIEHSERLPPVPEGLMQGGKFDERSLPKLEPKNDWTPIPAWMAGTWQFKSEKVTHIVNVKGRRRYKVPFVLRNEFQKTFGYQVDRSGQIWDYVKSPYAYTGRVDNDCLSYNRCSIAEIVSKADDCEIRKVSGSDTVYEPESREILLTVQKECINRYSSIGQGAIRVDATTKIFDTKGDTKVFKVSHITGSLVRPFEAINEKDGEDLKKLFSEYLTSAGKADLIP